jgi:hypothetical protein
MVTKWYKQIVKIMLASFGRQLSNNYCFDTPITGIQQNSGNPEIFYPSGADYPPNVSTDLRLNTWQEGFHVGSGSSTESDIDINLESTITSGLTLSGKTVSKGMDGTKPYFTFNMVLTNTTSSDITINEIGYIGRCNGGSTAGGSGTSNKYFLIDRTVLGSSLVVPANGNAALLYTIKTDYQF